MADDCKHHGLTECNGGYHRKRVGRKLYLLHRLVYCQHNSTTLEKIAGLSVRHTCDNPRCINTDHLILGTHQDNMADKSKRGRAGGVKLTREQAAEIRATCVPGKNGYASNPELSYSGLGRKFGVTANAVRNAYLGITLKNYD